MQPKPGKFFKEIIKYYCEDEKFTEPKKITLKMLRSIRNEGLRGCEEKPK